MLAPILTFFLGAATGALVMRRGRTAGQMLAALSGIVVAGYLLLLAGDLLALYLDYLSSRTWIATHLLSVDPLLLDAAALALSLLHFAIAPSVIWAFLTFQNRKAAILLGAVGCGSLVAMFLIAPKQLVNPADGSYLYKYSRDPRTNCIQLYNRELNYDPNTGVKLQEGGPKLFQEYAEQKASGSCKVADPLHGSKPTALPRKIVAYVRRPPEEQRNSPPFSVPAHNFAILAEERTSIWSEAVALTGNSAVVTLASRGWNESPGWIQPAVDESTYLTDQAGQRYRLLGDYGKYGDSCAATDQNVRCHKILPGEIYRFELAFERPSGTAKDLRLYYSGAAASLDAASFPVSIGEWMLHPAPPAAAPSVPGAPPNPQQVADRQPDPHMQPVATPQRAAIPAPTAPPPPVIRSNPCIGSIRVRARALPDRVNSADAAVVRMDWTTARVYLQRGARQPAYPSSGCTKRLNGIAILDILTGPDGRVRTVTPVIGSNLFVAASVQAVQNWQFAPVMSQGRPALLATRVQFDFEVNP